MQSRIAARTSSFKRLLGSHSKRLGFAVVAAIVCCLPLSRACADEVLVPSSQVNADDVIKFRARAQLPAKPKIGLALGGGGSRGAAEVGVLEVFDKEGIRFDCIAGTSIGSIVGGLYDAGMPLDRMQKEFTTGRAMRQFLPIPFPESLVIEPIMLTPRLVGFNSYDGLYPGIVFRKYLKKLVPAGTSEIENLKIPFAAVSLNLIDGKPYMIRGGSLSEAMRASSAVPGLRKPVVLGDKLFVDGGVACNLPVKQCREMGADFVIAVNIDEPFDAAQLKQFRKPGSVTKRMVKWDLYSIDGPQEEIADIVIHPDTSGVSLITSSRKAARKGIEAGRAAAQAALPQIRQKLSELGVSVEGKLTKSSSTVVP